jgi:hypothetical protein
MGFNDELTTFHGLAAFTFPPAESTAPLPEPEAVAWRITCLWYPPAHGAPRVEEIWKETFTRFCSRVDTTRVRALIIGAWGDQDEGPDEVIAMLLAAADQFPALRAVFIGDILTDHLPVQSIAQTDVTPLLAGFPALEELGVRAGEGDDLVMVEGADEPVWVPQRLEFTPLRHERLRKVTVQSAGLRATMVRGLGESDLPALEHLELWLGMECYGADSRITDLEPILSGARLPRLRHLALRNSEMQDEVAAALASAPVVGRLETLDVSLGELSDVGAAALLDGQPLTHLNTLDAHHNFLTEPMRDRIRTALEPAGVTVNLDPADARAWTDDNGVIRMDCAVFD